MIVPFGGRVDAVAKQGLARLNVCTVFGESRRGGVSPGVDRITGVGEAGGRKNLMEIQKLTRGASAVAVEFGVKRKQIIAGSCDRRQDVADRLDDWYCDGDLVTFGFAGRQANDVALNF